MKFQLPRYLGLSVLFLGLAACTATGPQLESSVSLSEEPLIGKFVWHDLMTDDVEAARRFYGGVLDWSFNEVPHPSGVDYTLVSVDGRYFGGIVYLPDTPEAEYSRWLPYLSVVDVDEAVATTESNGGQSVVPPTDLGKWARAAAVTDPQGAVVGLLRSRVGDPDDSRPLVAGQVVWNELHAADEAEAASFYNALAGLEADTIERRGGEYTFLMADGQRRSGVMLRPNEEVTPQWLTYFGVDDVNAATAKVTEFGGTVILPPSQDLREGRMAVVTA